ncbi:MAG: heavy metal-binding domain-containing protein, partial [Polyangiales bacterium]
WMLIKGGYRPVGFVMGNCVYYVPPNLLQAPATQSCELSSYTHALYDARELAIERLQDEAEELGATGIVGVTIAEEQHSWRTNPWNIGNAALQTGEVIELFVVGTAVVPISAGGDVPRPFLVLSANDKVVKVEHHE